MKRYLAVIPFLVLTASSAAFGDWDECYYACDASYQACKSACGDSISCTTICYDQNESCLAGCPDPDYILPK